MQLVPFTKTFLSTFIRLGASSPPKCGCCWEHFHDAPCASIVVRHFTLRAVPPQKWYGFGRVSATWDLAPLTCSACENICWLQGASVAKPLDSSAPLWRKLR